MSALTRYVIQNLDDLFVEGSNIYVDGFISTGKTTTTTRRSALYFRNITIPRGSTITSAYIHLFQEVDQTSTGVKTRFYGLNTALPKVITSETDYDARAKTTAHVDWDITSTWSAGVEYTSPDVKTIVQELVNRYDWGSGMTLGFLWDDNGSTSDNRRSPKGMDSTGGTYAPYIVINYTAANQVIQTLRASLPGYDAITDTDPTHFSLIADTDNVLIKEFARGTATVAAHDFSAIYHNLGYVPLFFVYYTSGGYNYMYALNLDNTYGDLWEGGTDKIRVFNNSGSSITVTYYIFYDKSV